MNNTKTADFIMKYLQLIILLTFFVLSSGCKEKSSWEKAGDATKEAADKVKDATKESSQEIKKESKKAGKKLKELL